MVLPDLISARLLFPSNRSEVSCCHIIANMSNLSPARIASFTILLVYPYTHFYYICILYNIQYIPILLLYTLVLLLSLFCSYTHTHTYTIYVYYIPPYLYFIRSYCFFHYRLHVSLHSAPAAADKEGTLAKTRIAATSV